METIEDVAQVTVKSIIHSVISTMKEIRVHLKYNQFCLVICRAN